MNELGISFFFFLLVVGNKKGSVVIRGKLYVINVLANICLTITKHLRKAFWKNSTRKSSKDVQHKLHLWNNVHVFKNIPPLK